MVSGEMSVFSAGGGMQSGPVIYYFDTSENIKLALVNILYINHV